MDATATESAIEHTHTSGTLILRIPAANKFLRRNKKKTNAGGWKRWNKKKIFFCGIVGKFMQKSEINESERKKLILCHERQNNFGKCRLMVVRFTSMG